MTVFPQPNAPGMAQVPGSAAVVQAAARVPNATCAAQGCSSTAWQEQRRCEYLGGFDQNKGASHAWGPGRRRGSAGATTDAGSGCGCTARTSKDRREQSVQHALAREERRVGQQLRRDRARRAHGPRLKHFVPLHHSADIVSRAVSGETGKLSRARGWAAAPCARRRIRSRWTSSLMLYCPCGAIQVTLPWAPMGTITLCSMRLFSGHCRVNVARRHPVADLRAPAR